MAEERVREVWDCSTDRRDGGKSARKLYDQHRCTIGIVQVHYSTKERDRQCPALLLDEASCVLLSVKGRVHSMVYSLQYYGKLVLNTRHNYSLLIFKLELFMQSDEDPKNSLQAIVGLFPSPSNTISSITQDR